MKIRLRGAALLCAVAGLLYAWLKTNQTPDAEPMPRHRIAPAQPTKAVPASEGAAALQTRPAQPVALPSAAAPRSALERAWGREVGSAGYGPALREILESGSPQAALEAARVLQQCQTMHYTLQALHEAKAAVPQVAGALPRYELESRRCQTVTPDLLAQRAVLTQRALHAQLPGAAAVHAEALLASEPAPGPLVEARQALLAAAQRREAEALFFLAARGRELELSDVQRQAAAMVLLLSAKGAADDAAGLQVWAARLAALPEELRPRLSAAQQAEAKALAEAWLQPGGGGKP